MLRSTSRVPPRSSQAFQRITTQLAIDIASSSAATERLTPSPWVQQFAGRSSAGMAEKAQAQLQPSTSNMSNRPARWSARKRTARRLPCA